MKKVNFLKTFESVSKLNMPTGIGSGVLELFLKVVPAGLCILSTAIGLPIGLAYGTTLHGCCISLITVLAVGVEAGAFYYCFFGRKK